MECDGSRQSNRTHPSRALLLGHSTFGRRHQFEAREISQCARLFRTVRNNGFFYVLQFSKKWISSRSRCPRIEREHRERSVWAKRKIVARGSRNIFETSWNIVTSRSKSVHP